MTDAELKKLCRKWQKILRMLDWEIDVRFGSAAEIDNQSAKVKVYAEGRQAVVRICPVEGFDMTDDHMLAFPSATDPEAALVHELLHIPFHNVIEKEPNEHEGVMQEQAIEQLARAFIDLSRSK